MDSGGGVRTDCVVLVSLMIGDGGGGGDDDDDTCCSDDGVDVAALPPSLGTENRTGPLGDSAVAVLRNDELGKAFIETRSLEKKESLRIFK